MKGPSAVAEITAFLQTQSIADWQDLEATGTITYPQGDTHTAYLTLMGPDYSRLDIIMDTGTRSLRFRGPSGLYKMEDGNRGMFPPSTATLAVLPFSRLWKQALTSAQTSISDAGSQEVLGRTLHRITVEYPVQVGDPTTTTSLATSDFYFDPETHLLVYSVEPVTLSETHNQQLLRITSYGSYQQMSSLLLPESIQQSLNGQLEWTLRITQILVNTHPPVSVFSF